MMWVHSFISRFKRAVLFVVAIIGVTALMNYLYVDDTDEFSRYMLHELYGQEENIDRLYIGSSHVFSDINPLILDEANGENNFNLATGTQQLITSYYLLREADKKHDLRHVYVDLYYDCTVSGLGNLHEYDAIPYSWNVLNQMKPSFNKLSYMIHLSRPEYYYLTFFAFTRYKEQLFEPDYVAGLVRRKQTETWKNHEYSHIRTREGEKFVMSSAQKGFMSNYATPEAGRFCDQISEEPLQVNPVTEESLEYFLKITDYCKENEIALTWIGCPVADYQLAGNGAYDNYVEQVKKLADQYDTAYYDFNLCKREYLDLASDRYWSDKGHLNSVGAEVFTRFLGEFLLAEESGEHICKEVFHGSYEEKFLAAEKDIFGMEIAASEDYDKCLSDVEPEKWDEYVIYKIHPVTNAKAGEVEIHVCPCRETEAEARNYGRKVYTKDEETEVVYDGNDGYVIFKTGEHGYLYVEAKLKDSAETKNWVEIEY